MKKQVKVRITTVREQTIRLPEARVHAHCHACDREVEMLIHARAAEILQVSAAALDGLIRSGQVHAVTTISGSLLVCKNSLLAG